MLLCCCATEAEARRLRASAHLDGLFAEYHPSPHLAATRGGAAVGGGVAVGGGAAVGGAARRRRSLRWLVHAVTSELAGCASYRGWAASFGTATRHVRPRDGCNHMC